MPGPPNAFQAEIQKLIEKLNTEKNPVEIAKLEKAIEELKKIPPSGN